MLPPSYSSPDDHGASSDLILTKQPDMSTPQVTESKMKNSGSGPKYAVSPRPVDLRYASARLASERGSRSYPLPSVGSITSQVMLSVVSSVNGSMRAESGSGESSMSDASIPFHPAIDEPSKAWPLSNLSCVNTFAGTWTCCSLPRVSVKRKSTNLTSLSLIVLSTSAGAAMHFSCRDRSFARGFDAITLSFSQKNEKQKLCHNLDALTRGREAAFAPAPHQRGAVARSLAAP